MSRPYTATQILKDREAGRFHFDKSFIGSLGQLLIHKGNKPMTIGYKVPAEDIVTAWEEQRARYEYDLIEAQATQKDLREKDVDDSCVNGKVELAERHIEVLTLQIKYIDRSEDVFLMDHEMINIFVRGHGLDNPSGAVEERRY